MTRHVIKTRQKLLIVDSIVVIYEKLLLAYGIKKTDTRSTVVKFTRHLSEKVYIDKRGKCKLVVELFLNLDFPVDKNDEDYELIRDLLIHALMVHVDDETDVRNFRHYLKVCFSASRFVHIVDICNNLLPKMAEHGVVTKRQELIRKLNSFFKL